MKLRLPIQQVQPPEVNLLSEARIIGGMNSRIDPADLSNNIATVLKNARTKADYTLRAGGVSLVSASPPDAKPVLLYTSYKEFDATTIYFRFSEDRVDKLTSNTYSSISGTLAGTEKDRIRFVQTADASNDYFIFTNNGANKVQIFNSALTSFGDLGDAGKYRYICAFFNRIVVANKVDSTTPNPVLIAWSGDFNFTQWNPSTDISAGSNPLVEAQSDYSDPITGLFAFASVMLILRERSLWIATKRPVASNPFNFQAAFPSVGCDTPNSATQTQDGIIWYDLRSNNVYLYQVGGTPQVIGDPVRDDILGYITDPEIVWGSYDKTDNTYFLTVPSTTSPITRIFVFNLSTQSWSFDERQDVFGVYPVDGGAGRLSYDQLTGTYNQISANNSQYNDIGVTTSKPPEVYYGYTDGELGLEVDSDTQSEQFCFESKIYRSPVGDLMISRLMLLYQPTRNGSMILEYRRNGGSWVTYKTVSFSGIQGRSRAYITKLIRANDFQWRVRSSTGNFKLLEYRIEISASPEDK
jgi:hypothetical protein